MKQMDYHLHTIHSFDGEQRMDELCQRMMELGVDEICLTEHYEPGYPDPAGDVPPIWDVWFQELQQMRKTYPQLTIRAGIEIGDNPLCRKEIEQTLAGLSLDYHLLSLHLVNGKDPYLGEMYFGGKTRAQAYREYAEAKAVSVCNWTDFDSVAHIGYVSRYAPWDGKDRILQYEDAPDAFDAIFKHVISLDKCLEVNSSTLRTIGEPLPSISLIQRYIALGGTCFTFGSDGHSVERDYQGVLEARALVKSLGGKYAATYVNRERILTPI